MCNDSSYYHYSAILVIVALPDVFIIILYPDSSLAAVFKLKSVSLCSFDYGSTIITIITIIIIIII